MLKLHLVSDAAIFNQDGDEYNELKEKLLEFFDKEPSKETIISRLFRKQKYKEPVIKYAHDIDY